MIDPDELEKYVDWVNDFRLNPPGISPEEYVEHLLNQDARKRMLILHAMVSLPEPDDYEEFYQQIKEIVTGDLNE